MSEAIVLYGAAAIAGIADAKHNFEILCKSVSGGMAVSRCLCHCYHLLAEFSDNFRQCFCCRFCSIPCGKTENPKTYFCENVRIFTLVK